MKREVFSVIYNTVITILAFASIVLCVLDIYGAISLSSSPYSVIDGIILAIFTIDYIFRLILSKEKVSFFKENIFDLIAILPLNSIFSVFRISRVIRLTKVTKLIKLTKFVRAFAFTNKLYQKVNRFLHTNNLLNMIYGSIVLTIVSSGLIMYFEEDSFSNISDALWWSVVTCTTVGYGDFYPSTIIGRAIAIILMLFGIGLLGTLTSAITSYFIEIKEEHEIDGLAKEMLYKFENLEFCDKVKVMSLIAELDEKEGA